MSATLPPPAPPTPQPAAGAVNGMARPQQNPLSLMAQQAAMACGRLVQTLKSLPQADQQIVEQAAAGLRQNLQLLTTAVKRPQ